MTDRTPAQIGAANRRAGRELERAAELMLAELGWLTLKTGSGQGGVIDLLAIAPNWPVKMSMSQRCWIVQCKTRGYVAPAERADLQKLYDLHSVMPVVAYWRKDGRKARQVAFKDLEGNEIQP